MPIWAIFITKWTHDEAASSVFVTYFLAVADTTKTITHLQITSTQFIED